MKVPLQNIELLSTPETPISLKGIPLGNVNEAAQPQVILTPKKFTQRQVNFKTRSPRSKRRVKFNSKKQIRKVKSQNGSVERVRR